MTADTALLWAGTAGYGLLLLIAWASRDHRLGLFVIGMIFLLRFSRELDFIETSQVATLNSFTPVIALAAMAEVILRRFLHAGRTF